MLRSGWGVISSACSLPILALVINATLSMYGPFGQRCALRLFSSDTDVEFFLYHCEIVDTDVVVEDWLIPCSEVEAFQAIAGTLVRCIHCGGQHPLSIRKTVAS